MPSSSKIVNDLARIKYGSLNELGKEIGVSTLLYNKFGRKMQGIKVSLLMTVLNKLALPLKQFNEYVYAIGLNKGVKSMRFPVKLGPALGELFAHILFDGYADASILRYLITMLRSDGNSLS